MQKCVLIVSLTISCVLHYSDKSKKSALLDEVSLRYWNLKHLKSDEWGCIFLWWELVDFTNFNKRILPEILSRTLKLVTLVLSLLEHTVE